MTFEELMVETRFRGGVYGFLAQAFRMAPTEQMLELLAQDGSDQAVAMGLVPDADFAELRRTIEADFNRVFLGMSPRAIAPYESVFTSTEHLLMQDARDEVLAAYRAEGVEIATDENLPEDHIAFELGFMKHLCDRTVECAEAGENDEAQRLLAVQKRFFEQHLANWVPRLCAEAAKQVSSPYYEQVCQALDVLIEEESAFFAQNG